MMKRTPDVNRRKKRIFIVIILMLLAGFTLLTVFVLAVPPSYIDLHVSEEIQERNNPAIDTIMRGVSWFGNLPVSSAMIVATALLFYLFRYKREALFVLLTAFAGVISSLLKMLINRPRPTADVVKIVEIAKRQSFPSGHTLFYIVFFGLLILLMVNRRSIPKPLRISVIAISGVLVFTIPFSRIYLGAHWFTDVLGGFILGLAYLSVLGYFYLFQKTPRGENA